MAYLTVTCPSCYENFEISVASRDEYPCSLDYDCEICCRPMLIHCHWDEETESGYAQASSLDD